MDDVKRALVGRRKTKSKATQRFSPSFAVHHGLISDPNWPPAHFPETGKAAGRKHRRVEFDFRVGLPGMEIPVRGDVSQGGAMFVLNRRVDAKEVTIIVKRKQARAEVVSTSKKGDWYAHHCRFLDAESGHAVWEAVSS